MITKYVVWSAVYDCLEEPQWKCSNEQLATVIMITLVLSIISIPVDIIFSPIEIMYLLILHIVNKKRPKVRI